VGLLLARLGVEAVTQDKSRAEELPEILIDAWVEWCSVRIYSGGTGPADLDTFLAEMRATVKKWAGWGKP
jgi:molybdopterin biosynthesis enzyme MoaB